MKTLFLLFALLSTSCAFAQNKDDQPKIDYWAILEKIKWKQN